jgi:hypothetical protein
MNKNLLAILIFVLVLVGFFWAMPDGKTEDIGDFFEKIITPIAIPLSVLIGVRLGIVRYKEIRDKKNKDL